MAVGISILHLSFVPSGFAIVLSFVVAFGCGVLLLQSDSLFGILPTVINKRRMRQERTFNKEFFTLLIAYKASELQDEHIRAKAIKLLEQDRSDPTDWWNYSIFIPLLNLLNDTSVTISEFNAKLLEIEKTSNDPVQQLRFYGLEIKDQLS